MVTKKAKDKKNADFKKVKLKIGRKLKKTNTTDTTVQAKKVVLVSQLNEKLETEDQPLSFRGLSLADLCKQLGHFNQNVRKDAIIGTKQLLTSRPDLIKVHLRTLIPSIARLISNSNNPSLNLHLKALLQVICTVPSNCMSVHFKLFMAHVLRGLSHMELSVRNFSLSILSILMSSYPELCRNDIDLFTSFVKFLNSSKKPAWNAPRFLETIKVFLNVYDMRESCSTPACSEFKVALGEGVISDHIDMVEIHSKIVPFDFPIMTSTVTTNVSPFELTESLLSLSETLCPILTTSLMEDYAGAFLAPTLSILESIEQAVKDQPNSFMDPDLGAKLKKIWDPLRKATSSRKNHKIIMATRWIEDC